MTIWGFTIEKRFWYFSVGALALIIGLLFVISSKPAPYDPYLESALPPNQLNTLSGNWLDPYISEYGVTTPQSFEAFTSDYPINVGIPIRFRVYLPRADESADRPDLTLSKYGWQFTPGVWIPPQQAISAEELTTLTSEVLAADPAVVGFPEGKLPVLGEAYTVTGLLFWHTARLNPDAGLGAPSAPVILAGSDQFLTPAELASPTTHIADLDIAYRQNNLLLNLKRVEWSSGRQVRLCLSVTNTRSTTGSIDIWPGLSAIQASYPLVDGAKGVSIGEIDESGSLINQDLLERGTPATGYVVFPDGPSGEPNAGLRLTIPALNQAGAGPPTEIDVQPNQFRDISVNDKITRSSATGECR